MILKLGYKIGQGLIIENVLLVIGYINERNYRTGTFVFNSLNDIIKTMNMTTAETRKVVGPIRLYNNPPTINPIILARLPMLLPTP